MMAASTAAETTMAHAFVTAGYEPPEDKLMAIGYLLNRTEPKINRAEANG